jgi:hypothetical protein
MIAVFQTTAASETEPGPSSRRIGKNSNPPSHEKRTTRLTIEAA